jgi:hypothetical protein
MTVPFSYTFMFPQSLAQYPTPGIDVSPYIPIVNPGLSATIGSGGSITLSVIPAIGFHIQLDAFGERLVNTKVSASFTHALLCKSVRLHTSVLDCPMRFCMTSKPIST